MADVLSCASGNASDDEHEEIPELFEDSEDEGSFCGFSKRGGDNDDSDLDLDGLSGEEDVGNQASDDTEVEEEEARWTDQLDDIQVPEFVEATGLSFVLDTPNELTFFLAFIGDDLWDLMVAETNRYAHQKLANNPERLARYREVSRAELKAFIAINIIMGIFKLPTYFYICQPTIFLLITVLRRQWQRVGSKKLGVICILAIPLGSLHVAMQITIASSRLGQF